MDLTVGQVQAGLSSSTFVTRSSNGVRIAGGSKMFTNVTACRRSATFIFSVLLFHAPAWADTMASLSVNGSSDGTVLGQQFFVVGTASCSNSGTTAACNANSDYYATNGLGPMNVAVSGYAIASYGHIGFREALQTQYHGGVGYVDKAEYVINETASASYSFLLDFAGLEASSVELTFLAGNQGSNSDASVVRDNYSVNLAGDPTGLFSVQPDPALDRSETFTETFSLNSSADSALVTVQGSIQDFLQDQSDSNLFDTTTLDLESIVFLDANGNPLATPEPAPFLLCGAALAFACALRKRTFVPSAATSTEP
jgi:hypothetical protein